MERFPLNIINMLDGQKMELQVEAYSKEYNFNGLHVVRPANIYDSHLNFNREFNGCCFID